MWNSFVHWIHHIINPHCEICKDEQQAEKICTTCQVLQHQLEVANFRNEQIIKSVLAIPEPEPEKDYSNLQPLKPRHVPFKVRRAALEELDRQRARKGKDATATTNTETPS